jgi:hypothetical protein
MEDQIIALAAKIPYLVAAMTALGTLVTIATVVAPLTPTKKDDDAIAYAQAHPIFSKVVSLLLRLSLIQPKSAPAPVAEAPKAE